MVTFKDIKPFLIVGAVGVGLYLVWNWLQSGGLSNLTGGGGTGGGGGGDQSQPGGYSLNVYQTPSGNTGAGTVTPQDIVALQPNNTPTAVPSGMAANIAIGTRLGTTGQGGYVTTSVPIAAPSPQQQFIGQITRPGETYNPFTQTYIAPVSSIPAKAAAAASTSRPAITGNALNPFKR